MSPPKKKRRTQNAFFREVPDFSDVMNGAIHTHVNSGDLIPLTMVRPVVLSGVPSFKTMFRNIGFKAGSDGAVVVRLAGTFLGELHRFVSSSGLSELEFRQKLESWPVFTACWMGSTHFRHLSSWLKRILYPGRDCSGLYRC